MTAAHMDVHATYWSCPKCNSLWMVPHRLPPMPEVKARRPLDDEHPELYVESLDDWVANNTEAVEWFLEHADTLRLLLGSIQTTAKPG